VIQQRLFGWIFKKELNSHYEMYLRRERAHKEEISKLRNEKRDLKEKVKYYDLIHRAFKVFTNPKIVAIGKNKRGEELFVVEVLRQSSLNVYLLGKSYDGVVFAPRIMGTVYINSYLEQNYIHIEDIDMVHNDVGNGQIAMKYYLRLAKNLGVEYIDGWLSPTDNGHFDRSEHYYKKFGFEVTFNENRTSGAIKKIMK
jgi:hypothetical protein